ncbi:uncharacterized protein THITE_2106426 [Thermothielavioides terrestris NRRL 8126]|uniref:Uncharacterized protein n=1 Tax=Thermothielavioides terrestris (strain ATCC 38088 / NRRL 8126) TaxID=578455 RepID=G2QXM7_THETT|nr:uncharacterized protein THITE_2106426 [Thermothielavioides terrestris NRRL 8126]AEO62345.1 hypothetical protein THITE_2106426 [Thermothielavioides terrestris NRRL 8126]
MAADNGSDDDELFVANAEPPPFTFQSDLSDDDAPDPLALDEIASASLAALNGILGPAPKAVKQEEEQPFQDLHDDGTANGVVAAPPDQPRRDATSVIEVCLPWLSPAQRAEYLKVEVDDDWPVEDEYLGQRRKRKGDDDYDDFAEQYGARKRKRHDDDYVNYDDFNDDSEDDEDVPRPRGAPPKLGRIDDYLEIANGRRSTRASTRASSLLVSSDGEHGAEKTGRGRRLRPRASAAARQSAHYDDRDELQDSDADPDDPTFAFVQSDIVQTKKQRRRLRKLSTRAPPSGRGLSLGGDSDIEFESRRRSSRVTNTRRVMTDSYVDDDDIYYEGEDRTPATPKVVSMREIFQPPKSYDFKQAHRLVCGSCGYADDRNKGALIPCQGCSNSYHKACIGVRSTRDHRVTKVAAESFVLQCRFCICIYKKKDIRAPAHDVCQGCHAKNPSCVPFSERKTPKQEEALRNANDGVDPITPVEPKLLENPDNVLFRCSRCHRAWHYEHLPHPHRSRDPAIDDPLNLRKHRREEYQITWLCKECQDTEEDKVDKIVAWRPLNRAAYREGQWITDFDEDGIEYLLKWENKSYNHCLWMPGAWVYGVVKPMMRQAFIKRTFGEGSDEAVDGERHVDSLLRWSEKEAIHDAWITPDIILDVHIAPRSREAQKKYNAMSTREKFDDDLNRIFHVTKIYVKFEGLGYDDAVWDTPPPPDAGPIYDAFCEAYHEYLNGKHFQTEPFRVMKERIERFRQLEFTSGIEVLQQPKGLRRGKLMEYQLEGLNWILCNFRDGRSVVLADEMGLGKTVQVVAFLSSFIQDNPRVWPFLIVVPNATCANWRREIKKWAPDLRVVAYYGGRVSQALALQYELFPNNSKELKAHVVIMSYDSAKDGETRNKFGSTKWAGLVVDEAQALKNDENALYRALNAMRIPFKLLLTGTPLQNNKRELFNLLQFIDPAMKAEDLDREFEQVTSENLPELHNLIRPYFLRRTKAEVLTFLPPMSQVIVPVSMTVLQERLCKSIMERNPELIRSVFVQDKMKAKERGSLSNILMQLRKCLCHPFIYSQAIEDRTLSPEVTRRNLIEASSKLMLLEIMLPKLKERGHRVLLFSQFLDQLTILEDFLAGMGLKHERLDGSASSMEKQKKIDAFNAPGSDIFAMLLSTRAGGVGINLATADTVIILDPDWNPHQDIQALSRAHRIGQRKKVLCFQLMTVDSAEEKILQIGRKKLALDHLLIETMDDQEDAPNDVESVLKHGAAALFGEGKRKDAIVYDSAAVDKLLDRSTVEETRTNEGKTAESAFAFARVWANDEGELADDLQEAEQTINMSVWDQILQQRAEQARREAERTMETLGRGGRRRGAANYAGPRFEFDETQEGPKVDSDQGDGDGDFVGSDKSGGESSEDEETIGTGESTPAGSNARKQGRASQAGTGPDAQDAAVKKGRSDARHAKTATTTTAAVLRPPAAQSDSEDTAQNSSKKARGRPRKDNPSGKNHAAAAAARVGGGGHVSGSSASPQPSQPASSHHHHRHGANPAQAAFPGGGRGGFMALRPSSGTVTAPITKPVSTTPIPLPVVPVVPSNHPLPPASAAAPAPTYHISGTGESIPLLRPPPPAPPGAARSTYTNTHSPITTQVQERLRSENCVVCLYSHPPSWECPEMRSEVQLRLAMDRLRKRAAEAAGEGVDARVLEARIAFLWEKLKRVQRKVV